MSTVTVDKLKFSYGEKEVLKDISFKVKMPSMISIIGPNNCGKSTLIKCLSGIMPVEESIMIDDIVLNKKNIRKYARNIGVIFSSDFKQFLFENVIDEIAFPLCNLNYRKKEIKKRINEMSSLLFLDDILSKKTNELNAVEKVKVLLAVALIHSPQVLLLDDILLGLNNAERERILLILKRVIEEQGIIVIMTSSNLMDTIYSDAVLVIEGGVIRYSGTLNDILEHDNVLTRLGLEIPPMMDISLKLKFYNLLDDVILDEEEMVNALWD